MTAMSGVLASYGGGSGPAPPPIPPTTGAVGIWALFNLNPVQDFAANVSGSDSTQDYHFVGVPPYPFDYAGLTAPPNDPPYLVNTWYDQLSANNLSASGSSRPILDVVGQLISFDGVANGMAGASPLYVNHAGANGTIYFDIAPASLVAGDHIILETGSGDAGDPARIKISIIAGVLTCSVYDTTAILPLPNTKVVTLANTSRIFGCFQWDTTQVTPANQTSLFVNNSSTGVTSAALADLNGQDTVGIGVPSVGARNGATSNFFGGSMWGLEALAVTDDATARLVQQNYNEYLKTQ